jgi:hypothetical protein
MTYTCKKLNKRIYEAYKMTAEDGATGMCIKHDENDFQVLWSMGKTSSLVGGHYTTMDNAAEICFDASRKAKASIRVI